MQSGCHSSSLTAWRGAIHTMKQHTINKILEHHAAALTGLSQHQHDAVLNALGAAYTAGNQARPDYNPPTFHGFDSEKLTPDLETIKRAIEQAGPVPQDADDMADYFDRVDTLKREGAKAWAVEA